MEFVVIEIAPDCRRVGRFRVAGHPGINRVRFRGRIGGRPLGPGTYRIKARTVPRGRAVVDTELVVVEPGPARDRILPKRQCLRLETRFAIDRAPRQRLHPWNAEGGGAAPARARL